VFGAEESWLEDDEFDFAEIVRIHNMKSELPWSLLVGTKKITRGLWG
jgi:hypothetical protein